MAYQMKMAVRELGKIRVRIELLREKLLGSYDIKLSERDKKNTDLALKEEKEGKLSSKEEVFG